MTFYILMAGVVVLDQLSKTLAVSFLGDAPVQVISAFFWLRLQHNPGAAFSLFDKHPEILTIINTIISALVIWWGVKIPQKEKLQRYGIALIAGGALGNLIDRFFRGGRVVDFLDFHWFNKAHWPTFNIADTAICIGVTLLIIEAVIAMKKEKAEKKAKSSKK